jgi:hypothetical protein
MGYDGVMGGTRRWLLRGLVAGAAGTTALYATTYLDMALRGRPASDTPKRTVQRMAEVAHVPVPGDDATRDARAAGLGTVLGHSVGLTIGVVVSGLRELGWLRTRGGTAAIGWALAMVVGNGPMSVLGVTDPRTWTRSDWLADLVPHLAYAVALSASFEAFER